MSATTGGGARTTRQRAVDLLRVGFLVVILLVVAVALWTNWEAVRSDLGRLGAPTLAAATLLALLSPFLTVLLSLIHIS